MSNFRIHGQVYHSVGPLLPEEGCSPSFAQLYIYDKEMLDECNPYIQKFRQVRDLIQENVTNEITMLIHGDRTRDPRRYNTPNASEVAAIMIGDGHEVGPSNRDILLRLRGGGLQRISELYPSYDPLHYVLLFPGGDDGWHIDIPLKGA